MADYSFTTALIADRYGLDPQMLRNIMQTESAGNPQAVSPKGATGLMQLMPGTAKELDVDPTDPISNVDGGARYFKQQLDRFGGDPQKALAAYNFGPGHVQRGDALPPETQAYIQKIMGAPAQSATPFTDAVNSFSEAAAEQPEKSFGGFGENIINSGANFVGSIADTLFHPIDTLTNVGKLGLGVAEKVIPGEQEHEKYADAVGHFYKERYGGGQNILDTAYSDPVGMAADLATILGIGGAALPGKLGRVARIASEITNPVNAVAKPLQMAGRFGAEAEMANALRPSATLRAEHGGTRAMAKAALADKIGVSDKLIARGEGLREGLAADRAGIEQAAMDAGRTANPETIYNKMGGLFDEKGVGKQMFPADDQAAVDTVMHDWKMRNSVPVYFGAQSGPPVGAGRSWTPIKDLLDLEESKQGTYRSLKNAFRQQLGERPGAVEAEKAASIGAKQALEDATTGFKSNAGDSLKDLNEHDARIGGVLKAAKARTDSHANFGIDAAMGVIGGHAAIPPIILHQFLSDPRLASWLALKLDWMANPKTAMLGKAGALQPNRLMTQKAVLMRALGGPQD